MCMKYISIQSIYKLEKVHVYGINNVMLVLHVSIITYEHKKVLLKTVTKYLH